MQSSISGPGAAAISSLSPSQLQFIRKLPKAELHAHLNGCIPLDCLQELAKDSTIDGTTSVEVLRGLEKLKHGVDLNAIHDFFDLFPTIYALTATSNALRRATKAVLSDFLDDENSGCSYLELRSTPKRNEHMTRLEYCQAVLDEVEKYPKHRCCLIVSVDRRMSQRDAQDCIDTAILLKKQGRRVVGVDLCGDPLAGDMSNFSQQFLRAKEAGLGITLHIAETSQNTSADTLQLLSFQPDRLGHATFLDETAKKIAFNGKMCIEICLSSNILCKTVDSLAAHHIKYHLKNEHPLAICTDDTLPFRNSLVGEYALLLAPPPLGIGLSEEDVKRLAQMSFEYSFMNRS